MSNKPNLYLTKPAAYIELNTSQVLAAIHEYVEKHSGQKIIAGVSITATSEAGVKTTYANTNHVPLDIKAHAYVTTTDRRQIS